MEEERDLVTFVDEDGNEFDLEVIDYFMHKDKEYGVLIDPELPDDAEEFEVCIMEIVQHEEEDLEIAPHRLPQMRGGRDLKKTQTAHADARRDEQDVDELYR